MGSAHGENARLQPVKSPRHQKITGFGERRASDRLKPRLRTSAIGDCMKRKGSEPARDYRTGFMNYSSIISALIALLMALLPTVEAPAPSKETPLKEAPVKDLKAETRR